MTLKVVRVAVLASGEGTNLQALLDAFEAPAAPARIVLVGCNRADAPAIHRAEQAKVAVCLADRSQYPKRHDRQRLLMQAIQAAGINLVVLAGFDEILVPEFVEAYEGRMLNTHPSLLPAFSGTMHAVQAALELGVKITGCTVHLVTNELDGGPILLQRCVEVRDDDDVASLHARVREQEHQLLPEAVRAFAEGRVRLDGRRISIADRIP